MAVQRELPFLQNLGRRFRRRDDIHVLVVDPNQAAAQHMVSAVQPPFSVRIVLSAEAAHAALLSQVFTIVVTELDLPDMPGLEMLGALRADAATSRVLLMVTTARSSLRDKIAAFEVGADDYLVKPVDPSAFAMHLERVSLFRQVFTPPAS